MREGGEGEEWEEGGGRVGDVGRGRWMGGIGEGRSGGEGERRGKRKRRQRGETCILAIFTSEEEANYDSPR